MQQDIDYYVRHLESILVKIDDEHVEEMVQNGILSFKKAIEIYNKLFSYDYLCMTENEKVEFDKLSAAYEYEYEKAFILYKKLTSASDANEASVSKVPVSSMYRTPYNKICINGVVTPFGKFNIRGYVEFKNPEAHPRRQSPLYVESINDVNIYYVECGEYIYKYLKPEYDYPEYGFCETNNASKFQQSDLCRKIVEAAFRDLITLNTPAGGFKKHILKLN